ncbi:MAG: hypothetical protein V1916_02785, partial [Patescibacteria group bacterium]
MRAPDPRFPAGFLEYFPFQKYLRYLQPPPLAERPTPAENAILPPELTACRELDDVRQMGMFGFPFPAARHRPLMRTQGTKDFIARLRELRRIYHTLLDLYNEA